MTDFSQIINSLNPEQKQAVLSTEGPLLVLAGAGTGKTKVLTSRIAHILYSGLAFPSQILAVTFTNKASKEMEHRIFSMVGGQSAGLFLGTFHSICLKFIRKHYALCGLKENFDIINQDDQLRLIKQVMKDEKIDEKRYPPKAIQAQINRWKDRALNYFDIVDGDEAGKVYQTYQTRLNSMNLMDFGDLILKSINLFKGNADILAEYHRRFKYILVDEYQDTNVAQYLLLRLLSQGKQNASQNICCVGDDDQSIYGWRGAEVGNILKFENDFPSANIIRLETNYRSTPEILSCADSLIANNQNRLGKNLKAFHQSGEKIKLVSTWDDRAEANFISDEIEAMQQIKKIRLDSIAILVRAGHQTRAFEESFVKRGISYRILGGLRFYDRLEIKDTISYIRSVLQSFNDIALERIINTPKRGLGEKTIEDLKNYGKLNNISLNESIRYNLSHNLLKPKIHKTLAELFAIFDEIEKDFASSPHHEVVQKLLEKTGYIKMWEDEKTLESKGRLENIKELYTAISEFSNINEFLDHISLVSDSDDAPSEDFVSVMTIHGAKGLEFENVFLPGWEDGIFPSQQTLDEGRDGLEEERRLAYVAITRAKKNLHISFASSRMVFGNIMSQTPSRFIDELPRESVEIVNQTGLGPNYRGVQNQNRDYLEKNNYSNNYSNSYSDSYSNQPLPKPKNLFSSDAEKSKFSVGEKIYHSTFGYGRVLNIKGKHLQIVFEKSAIKTLSEDFVEKAA